MTITGKIHKIKDTQFLGASNYPKKLFYLDRTRKDDYSDKTYPNFNEIALLGEKNTKLIESFQVGDIVDLTVEVRGNFFQHEGVEKFSQEINCWEIKLRRRSENPIQQGNPNPNVYNQQ